MDLKTFFFGKKAVPFLSVLTEQTREGINKAYIPKFLYKPPFGYPRYANLDYVRYLAQTPYVEMAIDTILKELAAIDWDIVPNPDVPEEEFKDEEGNFTDKTILEINHIRNFFKNPNTNQESFEDVFIKAPVRDLLEINTGVLNKVFNLKKEMVEIVARDGATFTKNPDIHGMMTDREEIIFPKRIVESTSQAFNSYTEIPANVVNEKAAYFQYGWISGPVPIPFGKREIIWLQDMVRSDDIYGYSKVQILAKNLQMLLYQIESDLEYYNDNNVPKGIIGLDASDADEIKSFKEQWFDVQRKKDEFGNWKKAMHKVPILNYIPKFERIEFSSEELQLIEKQKWYSKMVWAIFGVTGTELGYTEDAQGQANQIVQSKVFRKKAINPMLRLLENAFNKQILPEFGYNWILRNPRGQDFAVPKYLFKFNTFDIDEERNKYNLYEVQVKNGFRTVNEIREDEGFDPVEWGDEPPSKWQTPQSSFSFGSDWSKREQEAQEMNENVEKQQESREPEESVRKTEKELENEKSIESKPFAGYADFDACVRDNQDKDNPEAYCAALHKKVTGKWPSEKAITENSPLILKEGERLDYTKLKQAIIAALKENEKKIIEKLKEEAKEDVLKQIKADSDKVDKDKLEVKSVNDIIQRLQSLLNFGAIGDVAHKVIRAQFLEGAENAEEDINKKKPFNYVPDYNAIDYISNYTFDNIKNMTEELANDLRSELQRGFMNGEGISKLTERVKRVFDSAENRAETIARTETMRAHHFGKLSAFKQSGIKAKKWLLWTNDNRTSEITKALHKKYGSPDKAIPLDQNFKVSVKVGNKVIEIDQPAGPFHPNERDELMIEVE